MICHCIGLPYDMIRELMNSQVYDGSVLGILLLSRNVSGCQLGHLYATLLILEIPNLTIKSMQAVLV